MPNPTSTVLLCPAGNLDTAETSNRIFDTSYVESIFQ